MRLDVYHQIRSRNWHPEWCGGMERALEALHNSALAMLMIAPLSDEYRADAEIWLSRAALMPVNSWERERLTTAAKLNNALAGLMERRHWFGAQFRSRSVPRTDEIPASFSRESLASRIDHM